ncbi:MAG: flagellar hook-length control protein FliK [Thermoleophilia bacterium]|nr:flagellar hook-length control protein FliK [Thermoleophilia bacterium]
MNTPKVEGPYEPSGEHKRDREQDGSRPRRGRKERGPIGFGSVMRDVRKGDRGATPGMPGYDPALAQAAALDAGAQAALKMGSVETVGDLLANATSKPQSVSDALLARDRSATAQLQQQPLVPTQLGRMSPSGLIDTVLDESRRLEIEEAMKDLHVELEPEDLGPVVVRIRKGPDGALDIGFRTREGDAARVLEQGTDTLRDRLFDAGFAAVKIDVAHDSELQLGGR